jgi:hypothetical protein
MDNRREVKVIHPDYGHVIFHGPTPRQVEVLENIKAACTLADDVIAQNKILAGMISERDREIEELKAEVKRLGRSGDIPYIDFLN